MLHLAWIVPLALLIAYLSSPRFRGDVAESRVRRILASGLEKNLYTTWNDLRLPAGGGTRHIDHVVVSRFGIFVIESHYASGWISGTDVQPEWRQRRLGRSTSLANPLHVNRLQVDALRRLLDFPPSVFHPLVVLVGHKGFRKKAPLGVVEPERLIGEIRKRGRHELTAEQADRALRLIGEARLPDQPRWLSSRWFWLRAALLLALLSGLWFAYREDLLTAYQRVQAAAEQRAEPGRFHPDGREKTDREAWEDSLVCAYSADTGRCTCLEPAGARAPVEPETCRRLAERDSILKR